MSGLGDAPIQVSRGSLTITTDRRHIDLERLAELLRATHWGSGIPGEVLRDAVQRSVSFALLDGGKMIGFARAVTDRCTFAYLTDVVIDETRRGEGHGRWLVETVLAHPDLQGLRRVSLLTRDAEAFYRGLGFQPGSGNRTYMERKSLRG